MPAWTKEKFGTVESTSPMEMKGVVVLPKPVFLEQTFHGLADVGDIAKTTKQLPSQVKL